MTARGGARPSRRDCRPPPSSRPRRARGSHPASLRPYVFEFSTCPTRQFRQGLGSAAAIATATQGKGTAPAGGAGGHLSLRARRRARRTLVSWKAFCVEPRPTKARGSRKLARKDRRLTQIRAMSIPHNFLPMRATPEEPDRIRGAPFREPKTAPGERLQ
jgi:hypothetical protein